MLKKIEIRADKVRHDLQAKLRLENGDSTLTLSALDRQEHHDAMMDVADCKRSLSGPHPIMRMTIANGR